MKKIFYSLAIMVMGLASCTTWDDAVTEKYGDGPSIDVNVVAAQPSDSAFTITLTPAAGTTYYAFIIDESPEAETIDGYTLLKGGYGNSVVNTSQYPTLTLPIDGAEPNTTYQVYAVASNDKGIIGDVVVKSITTTDKNAPKPMTLKEDAANKAVQVGFNQAVKRGTGAVKAVYYKEWDWENPVTVNPEDIEVTISGKTVTFSVPNAPAGAFIAFSWEKGAFVDAVGNQCTAFTSSYDEKNDKFLGIWVHAANEAFEIEDSYVTPTDGSLIDDWLKTPIKITFPFDIYYVKEDIKGGEIQVAYINKSRTVAHNLTADQWSVDGKTLTITLPVEPAAGDNIVVYIEEETIFDVYGNPNEEYLSEDIDLTYFAPTKDMVIGSFDYIVTLDGKDYNLGKFTISENGNDFIVKDFYLEGSEMKATADFSVGKLYFPHLAYLGQEEEDGVTYNIYTYDSSGARKPSFKINADGTMTSTNLILVGNPVDTEDLYYWINVPSTTLKPSASAAKGKKAKLAGKKGGKLKATLK